MAETFGVLTDRGIQMVWLFMESKLLDSGLCTPAQLIAALSNRRLTGSRGISSFFYKFFFL